MPVINREDFWLADSDEIVKYLEQQVPEPSMASSVPADVTGSIFGAFRGFLMAKVRGTGGCVCWAAGNGQRQRAQAPQAHGTNVNPCFASDCPYCRCASASAQPEEEAAKKEAFLAELSKINAYLAQHGPLFGGEALNETDAATAPKLYHATVALGHFKGWKLDAGQFPAVAAYMQKLKTLPAWQHTVPTEGDAAVVAGWAKHMSG